MTKDEALKMAIEFLGKLVTYGEIDYLKANVIHYACKEALEQSVYKTLNLHSPTMQEPVAWMYVSGKGAIDIFVERHEHLTHRNEIPLYTHPHQWQGLTDDEIKDFWTEYQPILTRCPIQFARAIEQALKEKNT
jgi:hypothetical protein